MEMKDYILMIVAAIGALTGVGNTYNETRVEHDTNWQPAISSNAEDIAILEDKIVNLQIQNCLLINELNRVAGREELQQCSPN